MKKRKKKQVNVTITCQKGKCKVHPSAAIAQPGGTVVFKKAAADTVYIQVSKIGRRFKITSERTYQLKIPKTTRAGIYPYAAFCYEKAEFCTGSSMPIIIVPS
jgi:hypothetical protein